MEALVEDYHSLLERNFRLEHIDGACLVRCKDGVSNPVSVLNERSDAGRAMRVARNVVSYYARKTKQSDIKIYIPGNFTPSLA